MVSVEQIEQAARTIGGAARVRAVYLFGSYARKQARPDSDVDFFVIADDPLPRHKRSRSLYRLFQPYRFSMDILVYTPDEVDQARLDPLSLVSRVLEEGKLVYGKGA
jgi:uncharacterized protein